ncbi:hypothetical protein B0T22DRAFT_523144 [Podospora appendiculata]|uniref:Zn(2)-C6 fungal-type domain-containing protein n=1 Tax=Podospora appendiculata TaxID=314037 RepID=A0AAE0X0M5_9PEZI|nr:hypothetical protein B0T22DRAFT_523144 [Podospora appendiculata]
MSSSRRNARLHKSCTECRRRKQKCTIPPPGSPCPNCAKRWPQVECVFLREADPSVEPDGLEVTSSEHFRQRLLHPQHASQWSIYVLPDRVKGSEAAAPHTIQEFMTQQRKQCRRPRAVHVEFFVPTSPFGGILSSINCLKSSRIDDTPRNTELMYFFLDFVAPNLVSIDGAHMPVRFLKEMLPWMLQSQLFPNIALLMASVFQAQERGRDAIHSSEPLAIKVRVLSMINQVLGGSYDLYDVLRSIMNLVIVEWFWGEDESMWAHMRGMKELVQARRDDVGMMDPLFSAVLVLIDYATACCFETDLCVQDGTTSRKAAPFPTVLLSHDKLVCPLAEYPKRFVELATPLGLSADTARILDDVQSLTVRIIAHHSRKDRSKASKIRRTALWMHQSLAAWAAILTEDVCSDDQRVTKTILLAGLVYTEAIMTILPISQVKSEACAKELYANIISTAPARWKEMRGVFLWVLLVATPHMSSPASRHDSDRELRRKYLSRKMATAAQAVGQEDFPLAISYLRAFWLVQRWIADENDAERQSEIVASVTREDAEEMSVIDAGEGI